MAAALHMPRIRVPQRPFYFLIRPAFVQIRMISPKLPTVIIGTQKISRLPPACQPGTINSMKQLQCPLFHPQTPVQPYLYISIQATAQRPDQIIQKILPSKKDIVSLAGIVISGIQSKRYAVAQPIPFFQGKKTKRFVNRPQTVD